MTFGGPPEGPGNVVEDSKKSVLSAGRIMQRLAMTMIIPKRASLQLVPFLSGHQASSADSSTGGTASVSAGGLGPVNYWKDTV